MTNESKQKQKQKLIQYAVYAVMALIFAGSMWFIFAPSDKEKEKQKETEGVGLNMDIPEPSAKKGIISDKKVAYEQEQFQNKQNERMKSLNDFSDMVSVGKEKKTEELNLVNESKETKPAYSSRKSSQASKNPIENSTSAYKDMNKTLNSFYETPKEDVQVKQLKEELEQLKSQMQEKETRNTVDEQIALMERSYEMASRYLPQSQVSTPVPPTSAPVPQEKDEVHQAGNTQKKNPVSVSLVRESVV